MDPAHAFPVDKMSELRQPLAPYSPPGPATQAAPLPGSDDTMLSNNPSKKISGQRSAGVNRREEIELKQFERPVLDIERMTQRRRVRTNQTSEMQQYSLNRGGDIDEEMHFMGEGAQKKAYDRACLDDAQEGTLSSQAPYVLSNSLEAGPAQHRLYAFGMSLVAFIGFSACFTFVGIIGAPYAELPDDDSSRLAAQSSQNYLMITYLPFYSSAAIFSVLSFLVFGVVMLGRNFIKYLRFGVLNANDYYTNHDTLKVGGLLLSVFAGELLFGGLVSFFHTQQMSRQYGILQANNTAMLSLVALFFLLAAYFGFGAHLKMQQTGGAFLSIVGSICMYISLANQAHHPLHEHANHDYSTVASCILSLNAVAALCFAGVFIILKVNHKFNQIKFQSGMLMVSFIAFLSSGIILAALQCLSLLTSSDFQDKAMPKNFVEVRQQLFCVGLAATCFSLGLIAICAVLKRRGVTRSFALLCFVPAAQLLVEIFALGEPKMSKPQLACIGFLIAGALLMSSSHVEPARKLAKPATDESMALHEQSMAEGRTALDSSRAGDEGDQSAMIRLPVYLDNNNTFQ